MSETDALWGGHLVGVRFDPIGHDLELQVDVLIEGVATSYDLRCSTVVDLRFTNAIPEPWTYAEVTEIHTHPTDAGQCMVEIMLWSEDCVLACTCSAVSVAARS